MGLSPPRPKCSLAFSGVSMKKQITHLNDNQIETAAWLWDKGFCTAVIAGFLGIPEYIVANNMRAVTLFRKREERFYKKCLTRQLLW